MRKQKDAMTYLERLRRLKQATLEQSKQPNRIIEDDKDNDLPSLEARVGRVLGIIRSPQRPQGNMLFFIMYDIESDKVRYNVVKYLERKGCTRIQKSIFLADLSREIFDDIKHDLAEIQALYENHDSIIICPISTDLLQNMKVIGQSINVDIITHNKNTLFF